MRFLKYILIISILIAAFSCKKTNLTVTDPGPDFILNKLINGVWEGVSINGGTLNLNGQDYKFEDSLLGIAGIFANENEYIIAAPLGNLITITTDSGSTDGLKEIIDIVGQQNAVGVINGIANSKDPTNIKPEEIIGNSPVTEEEIDRIGEILGGLQFGTVDSIPSK